MIYIKKIILTIIATIFTVILYSQEKNINIISSGDGITKDEATNAALRHCIEKTLGAFVSTNTTVINEKLITDEITTIASGNIINYEEISSVFNNSIYTVWVSAIISPENIIF